MTLRTTEQSTSPSKTEDSEAVEMAKYGPADASWEGARTELEQAVRDMADRVVQQREENVQIRGELRKTRLRESALREEKATLLRDLQESLNTVEKILDLLAVSE